MIIVGLVCICRVIEKKGKIVVNNLKYGGLDKSNFK